MASSTETSASLEYTPTWIVAVVCFIIVAISLIVERCLHYLGKCLKRNHQNALFEALQKLKEELMLLGFISLLLTVFQNIISHICIPASITSHMLPCKRVESSGANHDILPGKGFTLVPTRRLLAGGATSGQCTRQGEVPLLSLEALHQLHIFIFVLAVVHTAICLITVVLGGAKIRKWKHWEQSIKYQYTSTAAAAAATQGTSVHIQHHLNFLMEHDNGYWRQTAVISFIMALFKQFHASVTKSDYFCLRHGFIMKHCRSHPTFDFHKYMMATLEADFKRVVGISWYLWLFVVIYLLLDINGWHAYFWLSFLPLVLLLIVGAKLQLIITRLAQDSLTNPEEDGAPTIKPSDEHFWFHRPNFVLHLIHFILFQNAFEMAFFLWILCTYGFDSCIMESLAYVIPRLIIGVLVQVLCSYSTLPLYTIVTQMGDSFKEEIFQEHIRSALFRWVHNVRRPSKSDGFGRKGKGKKSSVEIDMQTMESQAYRNDHHSMSLEEIIASINETSDST